MSGIVLYGTGSPVIVDVEESLHRAGLTLAAGIRNRPGACHLSEPARGLAPDAAGPGLRALPFLVPLFTPAQRHAAATEAAAAGFTRPFTLIDPSVPAPRSLETGEGAYVNAGCTLGGGARLGAFVFVNRGASIGHHARLDAFCSLGPGVVLAGLAFGAVALTTAGVAAVAKLLDKRAETIKADIAEARRLRDEAQDIYAGYERRQREVMGQRRVLEPVVE